jgi:2-dehydropantoate 2-reductase
MTNSNGSEEVPRMRWLIFGCGGVGGYFGARLAQQGQRVSFMVRNQALAALRKHGVRVKSICGDATVPPEKLDAIIDTGSIQADVGAEADPKREKTDADFVADVILLCCKAWEAKKCLEMCRKWCGADTLILPLQNGVEGFDTIKDIVKGWGVGHALAGCCNIVAAIQEPGMIRHWAADPPYITFGEYSGPPSPKVQSVAKIFSASPGMEGHLESEAMPKIWEKFAFICASTAVGATCGPAVTQDIIGTVPEIQAMWRSVMHEIIALARSYGHKYKDEWLEDRVALLQKSKGATTSCSRDIWAGRPSELDDLLGSVVRMGKAKGIPTPVIGSLLTTLLTRERLARQESALPIYPLLEGQKVLGTICNHKGQQLPADKTLVQKKAEDYAHPEWFVCPMSSCTASGGNVEVPPGVQMGWEVELGVVISRACHKVPKEKAMEYVGGYVVVLDMTGLSDGFESMKHGLSWTLNKCRATWKPVGRFIPASEIEDPHQVTLVTKVNGKEVARDSMSKMKFSVQEQVADASALTPLQRGDVLLAGAGSLGPMGVGDTLEGFIEGLGEQFQASAKLVAAKAVGEV